MSYRFTKPITLSAGVLASLVFSSCAPQVDNNNKMIVSVRDQKMVLMKDNQPIKTYKISTSKFGVGDNPRSNRTPLGHMEVAKKIGCGQPAGAVFKSRRPTGEVIKPNAPGRDPIVSRILWLRGADSHNRNAFKRYIYIHGTPEMHSLGSPASYGCIRMGMKDVIDLYNRVGTGADVYVVRGSLGNMVPERNLVAR